MVRDDGSRSLTAFISVIEWPRIPAVYLKDLGNIKILDFKKPNSTEYRIRFLFEEDIGSNGYDKFSEIDGDICDIISDFGKRETGILDLYMLAFKLAKEQLKISKED